MASTITVGDAASRNEKEVRTEYPVVEGLIAGTTKQTKDRFLKPEFPTRISKKDLEGLHGI